jgi:hypothetical protein
MLSTKTSMLPRRPPLLIQSQQTRPLDPLTPEEIDIAARTANDDARVKKELGSGRHQLIQVQSLIIKADSDSKTSAQPDPLKPVRYAAVLFYRYDIDQGIYVIVDLNRRAVGDITRLEGRAVPLAQEEVSRAFALALLNHQLRTLLGPQAKEFQVAGSSASDGPTNRVEGLRVIATSPRDPCYRHRCIELHFRKREGYVPKASVTVDLSALKVKIRASAK